MAQIDIQSAEIAHALSLIRASVGIANSVKKRLDSIENQIIGLLSKHDSVSSIRLRNQLIAELNAIVLENMDKVGDSIVKQVNAIAGEEIKYQRAVLLNGTTATRIVKPATEALIKRVEKNPMVLHSGKTQQVITVAERIESFKTGAAKQVSALIYNGWQTGATTAELSKQILGTTQADSLSAKARQSAYMLAKDLTSHVSSQAKKSFAELNKDIIIGVGQLSTLDSDTTPICQHDDQMEWLFKDFPNPPLCPRHYRCRSTNYHVIAPEYRLDIEDTRPMVVDGEASKVSGDKSYFEVASKWPTGVLEEALGVQRAKLLKGLGAEDYKKLTFDAMNDPIDLDQLVSSNKRIAKILGGG
jgi:hypothetical protein